MTNQLLTMAFWVRFILYLPNYEAMLHRRQGRIQLKGRSVSASAVCYPGRYSRPNRPRRRERPEKTVRINVCYPSVFSVNGGEQMELERSVGNTCSTFAKRNSILHVCRPSLGRCLLDCKHPPQSTTLIKTLSEGCLSRRENTLHCGHAVA
jgi:hypothetical protein